MLLSSSIPLCPLSLQPCEVQHETVPGRSVTSLASNLNSDVRRVKYIDTAILPFSKNRWYRGLGVCYSPARVGRKAAGRVKVTFPTSTAGCGRQYLCSHNRSDPWPIDYTLTLVLTSIRPQRRTIPCHQFSKYQFWTLTLVLIKVHETVNQCLWAL